MSTSPPSSQHQTELQICLQIKNKLEKPSGKPRTHTDGFVYHNIKIHVSLLLQLAKALPLFLPLMCHDRTNSPINTLKSPERPAPCRKHPNTARNTYYIKRALFKFVFFCPAATYLRKRASHSGFVFGTNSWERPPLLPLVYVTGRVILI